MKNFSSLSIKTTFFASIFSLSSIASAANSVIDVLVVYTNGAEAAYSGDPTTRINQLFQTTNQIYTDSGVDLEIRVAKTLKVNYTDDNSAETALNAITNGTGAFSGVAAAREQANADMVILYRPFKDVQASCGLAWIGGQGTNGDFSGAYVKKYMYSHVAMNTCSDFVTAHELGHNMGLKHSRKQDGSGGTFPYALGYGVDGKFTTIMAYPTSFNVDYWTGTVYKFSQPGLTCRDLPCGVDRTNATSGADAHYTLNITGPQIANFYVGSAGGASSASGGQSSSTSSVGVTDVNEANTLMLAAKVAYDAAAAALADNKAAIAAATKEEATKKALLAKATADAKVAKTAYDKAVTTYNASVTELNAMQAKITAAGSKYEVSTGAAKEAAAKAYNALVVSYAAKQTAVANNYNAAVSAQAALSKATSALTSATSAYNTAAAATAELKSQTAALTADVKAKAEAYTAALKLYNTLKAKK